MKRFLKIVLLGMVLPILGLAFCIFIAIPVISSIQAESESVRLLSEAKSTNELAEAVGSLGVMMQLTNGGRIAIRYRDMHSPGFFSCAIARDSDGNWFESRRHFCGNLRYWPTLKVQPDGDDDPFYREMLSIENATNMPAARIALEKLGFKAMVK